MNHLKDANCQSKRRKKCAALLTHRPVPLYFDVISHPNFDCVLFLI